MVNILSVTCIILLVEMYEWLIDWIVFYAVSSIFQPYNGGKRMFDVDHIMNIEYIKKMGEFGGQNAHSTLNTDCESGVLSPHWHFDITCIYDRDVVPPLLPLTSFANYHFAPPHRPKQHWACFRPKNYCDFCLAHLFQVVFLANLSKVNIMNNSSQNN